MFDSDDPAAVEWMKQIGESASDIWATLTARRNGPVR